jgi:alpha-beta hydrolase superfamily lysophospholipase
MWRAAHESGQGIAGRDDPTIRIPNGTLLDLQAAARGNPVYDPTDIDVPTLVARGSHDPTSVRADALAVFDAVSSDHVEYVEIDGGTHFLHLEPKRHTLYESVNGFHGRIGRL